MKLTIKTIQHFSDITQLRQEISGLEELSRQLFLEAHDARTMREKIEWSHTFQGKYFNFLGYFFSLYCIWKIFIVSILFFMFYEKLLCPVPKNRKWFVLLTDGYFWRLMSYTLCQKQPSTKRILSFYRNRALVSWYVVGHDFVKWQVIWKYHKDFVPVESQDRLEVK